MQTTAVCGLGLSPFVFADFVPTAQFAWMMIALLALAIVGDLILLPALLSGPFGAAFTAKGDTETHNEAEPTVQPGASTSAYAVSRPHEHALGR